jgi:hypothetical protein
VISPQPYNTTAAIKFSVPAYQGSAKTFFVRHGDILSKIMTGLSILLLVIVITLKILKRTFKNKPGTS